MTRSVVFVLVFPFIISCETMPESSSLRPVDWEKTLQTKRQLMNWDIRGRLGLQTADNGGTFDLIWNRISERYSIRLIAPLGQGAFHIKGDAQSVSVRSNDGFEHVSDEPQELFREQLGVDLPVENLTSWILGIPSEEGRINMSTWYQSGELHVLRQAGWKIEMSRYQIVGDFNLPHQFVLQKDGDDDLVIRLIIRRWSLA